MAKTSVTDWDTTAANNTDINSIDIDENCAPSGINNAIREQMAQIATAMTTGGLSGIAHLAKASTYTVLEADRGKCIDCSAALTLNLTAAATMQAGWACYVKADGGDVTVDPNSTEQIEGAATLTVSDGSTALIYTDGTAWYVAISTRELLDEDNMASDSATKPASQQSVKAYVDAHLIDEDDMSSNSAVLPPSQQSTKAYVDNHLLDEDDMASDSATKPPSQQSVKAYTGLAFIEEQTASTSATIEFDLPTGYTHFMFVFDNVLPVTDSTSLYVRTSTDGGSTFDSSSGDYAVVSRMWDADANATAVDSNSATAIVLYDDQGNSTTSYKASGQITIYNPSSSVQRTNMTWEASHLSSSGADLVVAVGAGSRRIAEDVDAIQFLYSSGNISTGTFRLYGIV